MQREMTHLEWMHSIEPWGHTPLSFPAVSSGIMVQYVVMIFKSESSGEHKTWTLIGYTITNRKSRDINSGNDLPQPYLKFTGMGCIMFQQPPVLITVTHIHHVKSVQGMKRCGHWELKGPWVVKCQFEFHDLVCPHCWVKRWLSLFTNILSSDWNTFLGLCEHSVFL